MIQSRQDHTLGYYTKTISEWRFQGLGISPKLVRSNVISEQNKHGGGLVSSAGCTCVHVVFCTEKQKARKKKMH